MNRTKAFWNRGRGWTLVAALLVLGWLLAGCGAEPTAVVSQPTAAPTAAPTQAPTATATPTEPPPTDTPIPTDTPTPEVVDDSACVACHTSEETLKALAKGEAKPEVESEGEG